MFRITNPHYLIVSISAVLFTLFISMTVGSLYTSGDQVFYREIYKQLAEGNFLEAYLFYSSQVNAIEIIHFSWSWVAAKFIQKDLFIAIVNCFMTYYFIQCCKKIRIYPYVALLLVLSNFYFYVLFFAAERLKFGFFFLFLSFFVLGSRKKIGFSLLAVIGHVQMLILIASVAFSQFSSRMMKVKSWYMIPKVAFLYIFLGLALFVLVFEHVAYKLPYYLKNGSILSILKPTMFMLASIYCSRQLRFIIPFYFPLIIASFIMGDERITLFAYFGFIYFSAQKYRGLNIPSLIFCGYFMFKSLLFIDNIFMYGEGF